MSETPTVGDNRVAFRLEPDELAWLESRRDRMRHASRNAQAKTELGQWRAVMAAELRRIRLTLGQAMCLADITNGHLIGPVIGARLGLLYAEAYDAFRLARQTGEVAGYGRKHGIDEQELLDLLAGLGPAADAALQDALSRWWQLSVPNGDPVERERDAFRQVGMTIVDSPNEEETTQ